MTEGVKLIHREHVETRILGLTIVTVKPTGVRPASHSYACRQFEPSRIDPNSKTRIIPRARTLSEPSDESLG